MSDTYMLMISSFSNLVNELLIPIAQKDTAIAMVIAIATIMIVEMTMLMPFLLRCRFRLISKSSLLFSVPTGYRG